MWCFAQLVELGRQKFIGSFEGAITIIHLSVKTNERSITNTV